MRYQQSASPCLWDFCLSLYAYQGVEGLCLRCQDRHGLNVNLILWALWLDTSATPPDPRLWRAGEQLARRRQWCIGWWRCWRRRLPRRWRLRSACKSRELAAEKALLLQLERLTLELPLSLAPRANTGVSSCAQAPADNPYYLQKALAQAPGTSLFEEWRTRLQSWQSRQTQ